MVALRPPTVSAAPDGSLVELSSGTALSYLFWEAHSTGDLTPTSIATEKATKLTQPFNPNLASLTPTNSLALPFADLLPYLDATLKSLTLHTSARNDFSTYWLPSFARIHNRGQRIALRFVEQAAYQQAAKLEVEPEPDVVTRVFMLFKGVQQGEVRGEESFDWSKIVGVEDGADDATKFRVLEWGGMEVLS